MEFYKKVFVRLNVILLLIATCLAQIDSSTRATTYSSVELKTSEPFNDSPKEYLSEEEETEIQTATATPLLDLYTPSPIFPSDETKYTTNETLIQQLLKLNENDSEVDDLVRENDRSQIQYTESQENDKDSDLGNIITNRTEDGNETENISNDGNNETENISNEENNYDSDLDENRYDVEIPKSEMEWIENGENTEDDKKKVSIQVINETINNSSMVHYTIKTDYFGVFTGFFIIIAVILYLIVTAWRRMVQQRYRDREMLINDEEFYNPNDMKHFSI